MSELTERYLTTEYTSNGEKLDEATVIVLKGYMNERETIINRGLHVESVLLEHGWISRRAITSRNEGR